MILYDAIDIKVADEQVLEVRAGTELVWPTSTDFWVFDTPSGGEEINLLAGFIGAVQIDWGDGSTDVLSSGTTINHTY
jgi:hypothetical protein